MKRSQHSFLRSKYLQNHFIRRFLWPNLDLNSFERFASLYQEMVSTSLLKNLQKTEKRSFQTLKTFLFELEKTFLFELEVAPKSFSKKLPTTKFRFKTFWMLCLTYPENSFNSATQKLAKNWKMLYWNAHNIHFWAQRSFKTIFQEDSYDQILI